MFKISVVMSVYNGEKFLNEAIESILSQTVVDFEFIIINDGSTDGSLEIIKRFQDKDKRIKVVSHENRGLVFSLNEGVNLAQGEYIVRMDADDVSCPDRIEKQMKLLKERDLVVCGCFAEKIDSCGNKIGDMFYPPTSDKIKTFTLLHNPFIHPTVVFKKSTFVSVGGYRNFKNIEDYELWTRMIFKFKTGNLQEPLLKYRVHDKQITRQKKFDMKLKGIFIRFLALLRYLFRF